MIGKSLAHFQVGGESSGEIYNTKDTKTGRKLASRFELSFRIAAITFVLLTLITPKLIAQQSTQSSTTSAQPGQAIEKGPCRSTVKIYAYTRMGTREETFIEPGVYCQIELAPDDRHFVLERRNEYAGGPVGLTSYDLWLADFESRTFTRWITNPAEYPRDPVWSPDSKRIGYRVWADQQRCELHTVAMGSYSSEMLSEDTATNYTDDWTPDGKFLLYHTDDPDTVALQPVSPHQLPEVILEEPGGRNSMRVSPDGQWIAYGSNESGTWEIYVAAFPSFKGKHRVTQGGGVQVRWRRDSKEYYYLDSGSRMMAQGFDPMTGREDGKAKFLFQTSLPPAYQVYFYAVNSDGTKFFLVEPETDTMNNE